MTRKTNVQSPFVKYHKKIVSKYLNREVIFDIFLPINPPANCPVLFMNDGQDSAQLKIESILDNHYQNQKTAFVWVAIYAHQNRLVEYGTAFFADYKNRGAEAANYMYFVLNELKPMLNTDFLLNVDAQNSFFCGFSLGGLSAFDIVFENPDSFSKVGVFSGSFWWRSKGYDQNYDDLDRIMHHKIEISTKKQNLEFWLQCGTNDETEDRNNNGIIDSIDDTLDIIKALKSKGYQDIVYEEVMDGEHNYETWFAVFPKFLDWLFDLT